MKKIKWSIMGLAIIFSICAAFATRPKFDCIQAPQYYFNGSGYNPAGTFGVDYICEAGTGACTYFTLNGINYYPCELGSYFTGYGLTMKTAPKSLAPTPSH